MTPDLSFSPAAAWERLRSAHALVHCITNYVTVTDCANVLLACGAAPVMSDEELEVEEMASLADALCLNLGTLDQRTVRSMRLAAEAAARKGIPILLDPVGAGATRFRTETARHLLKEFPIAAIRCNYSEIMALCGEKAGTRGVDAATGDALNEENRGDILPLLQGFSRECGALLSVSGATDLVTDGSRTLLGFNGRSRMTRITGSGCMLSAVTAGCLGSSPDRFAAASAAVCAFGVAGEIAEDRLSGADGMGCFHTYFLDAVGGLSGAELARRSRCELC